MTEPDSRPRPMLPRWLAPAIVVLLFMQLVLAWVQGGLLHRQHKELLALREDVQVLTETLEEGLWQEDEIEGSLAPAYRRPRHGALQRVCLVQEVPPQEEEPAQKELQETTRSAQDAVKKAREAQSQLSIEENYRKAEEKKALESGSSRWQMWALVALGAGLLTLGVRAWLRSRE